MTNWEISISELDGIGVGAFNVPEHLVKWLKDNVSNKEKRNHKLSGHIKKEYGYKKWPTELEEFIINSGSSNKKLMNYTDTISVLSKGLPFYIDSLWVNIQKKYEFNPLHNHEGVWSFIIFLEIPYKLKDEDEVFPKNTYNTPETPRLNFVTVDPMGGVFANKVNVDKSFEGKMLMFPAKLPHLVYPFYTSNKYRITVSGNIKLKVVR